jgi:hypothetical protein
MANLWPAIFGGAPGGSSLAVLATQVDVETGWTACWNYNVGNLVPHGGGDYVVVSGITLAAFTSWEDGVGAFLRLLKARYGAALASAAAGDLAGYAANLKAMGYYGASEGSYLALLQARYPKDAAAVGNPVPQPVPAGGAVRSAAATWGLAVVGGLAMGAAAYLIAERVPLVPSRMRPGTRRTRPKRRAPRARRTYAYA